MSSHHKPSELEKLTERSQEKSRFRKISEKIYDTILVGVFVFHVGTQSYKIGHDIQHDIQPSPIRQEFEQKTGISINGWKEDVEGNPQRLSTISKIIEREQHELPFMLNSIDIESENYLKRGIFGQAGTFFNYGGVYNSFTNIIAIKNYAGTVDPSLIHHEIKHAKEHQISKNNPEFKKQWKALTYDSQGESLYLSLSEQLCNRIIGLQSVVDKNKTRNDSANRDFGFITSYARTNFYEDVAEIGTFAEDMPVSDYRYDVLYEQRNPRILAKVKLAEEYGIVPKGFLDYVWLRNLEDSMVKIGNYPSWGLIPDATVDYLMESERFLEHYPDSVYEAKIRSVRGDIMSHFVKYGEYGGLMFTADEALAEYKQGLTATYKDPWSYEQSMIGATRIVYANYIRSEGDAMCATRETYRIWGKAHAIFTRDFRKCISRCDVNDYLRQHGLL